MSRRRLDAELVRRGFASSLDEARSVVERGLVTVSGRPVATAASMVAPAESLQVRPAPRRFVSRGGEKLDAALERFGVDVRGRECLDAGASTGGFTDCMLQRGAAHVLAVDVGYGDLAWSLRTDPRVIALERTNVRGLRIQDLPFAPSVIVADLSFVSLETTVPVLAALATDSADLVALVKPQFEAPREDVQRGGVVREPDVWRAALERVASACSSAGLAPVGVIASPLQGPSGNVEFLLHAIKGSAAGPLELDAAIEEGRRIGAGGMSSNGAVS